jgi:acyl phosphate:glycerol-3-phosphate acyltransferase
MTNFLSAAAVSYLLGSIPFGFLLVRIFRGDDIRESGSGNIGATNVARTSPVLGVVTLLLDALKGGLAVWLATRIALRGLPAPGSSAVMNTEQLSAALQSVVLTHLQAYVVGAVAALFAVVGHMFPVWLKFRGGKGVATGLGSFVLLAPKAVVVAVAIFGVVVLAFRYVSLGSITAVAAFPVLAWLLDGYGGKALLAMTAASVLIIAKHHRNIRRLLAGKESRLQWGQG